MKSLQQYIADEYKDKRQQAVDTSEWKIRYASAFRETPLFHVESVS